MKDIKKVYMIEMNSEDSGPQIIGIATSEEKRDKMLAKLRNYSGKESGLEYESYPFFVDCLIINDKPFLFRD